MQPACVEINHVCVWMCVCIESNQVYIPCMCVVCASQIRSTGYERSLEGWMDTSFKSAYFSPST